MNRMRSNAMQVPIQIVFENISQSEALATRIRDRVRRIESAHPRLLRCQIAVSHPHRREQHGNLVNVTIVLYVPGDELIVKQHGGDDVYRTLQDAFDAARGQLVEHARRNYGQHSEVSAGRPDRAQAA
jgi:ribosome-associated translation inhibitor RaiA